jgi:DNA end-binding protein Ku
MARAIWSGSISFGLVNIPVKLYSAVSRQTVRFHQLDASDGTRIRQKRVRPDGGEEVPFENIVKGYEIAPDRYVTVTPEELEALEPRKTRTIEIEDFVDLQEIDPIFYDHPYYLVPDKGAIKPYFLLLEAMKESGKVAIARVVIRSKEQLVAIRPAGHVLTMETMLFADEVVPPEKLDDLPEERAKTSKRERDMARQLIDSLAGEFDPGKYRDEYRDRVLDLIERKSQGEEIVVQEPEEEPAEVPDLMAALEASIAGAKRQSPGDGRKRKPARASSNGADGRSRTGKGSAKSGSGSKARGGARKRATAKKR